MESYIDFIKNNYSEKKNTTSDDSDFDLYQKGGFKKLNAGFAPIEVCTIEENDNEEINNIQFNKKKRGIVQDKIDASTLLKKTREFSFLNTSLDEDSSDLTKIGGYNEDNFLNLFDVNTETNTVDLPSEISIESIKDPETTIDLPKSVLVESEKVKTEIDEISDSVDLPENIDIVNKVQEGGNDDVDSIDLPENIEVNNTMSDSDDILPNDIEII